MDIAYIVLGGAAVAALWVHVAGSLVRARGDREARAALATLHARLEACAAEKEKVAGALALCEAERAELRKMLEERGRQLEELRGRLREASERAAALEEELRRTRERCEVEKARLEEECSRRMAEVARVSRTAATLYEAVRDGAVQVVVPGRNCIEVILEPDKILCQRRDGSLEVVYPESARVEEAIVVKPSASDRERREEHVEEEPVEMEDEV